MKNQLSWPRKIVFSLGAFGVNLIGITLSSWILFFYAPPDGLGMTQYLPATLVGLLLTLANIWDSIIDPFIGQRSDNTRSRFGRRKPFLLIGAPVEVVAFVLIFVPPAHAAIPVLAAYLLGLRLVFFTAHSMVCIPYDGLIAEMTPIKQERVQLAAFKNFFGLFGVLIGSFVAGMLFDISPLIMTLVIGIIGGIAIYAAIPAIKENKENIGDKTPVFKGIKLALKNKPFIILSITAIIYQLITNFVLANNAYVVSLLWGGTSGDAGIYLGAMVLIMMVWAFLWMKIGKKVPSKKIYTFNFWCLAAAGVFTFFSGQIGFIPANIHYIIGLFFIAPFLGGITIYSFSMMGSVVDYDEVLNHTRREALFYGAFSLASGIGTSLATLILPWIYELFGYTKENPAGTRVAFLFIALLCIIGALVSYKYKLGDNIKTEEGLNTNDEFKTTISG